MFASVVICAYLYSILGIAQYRRAGRFLSTWLLLVFVFTPLFAVDMFLVVVSRLLSKSLTTGQQLDLLGKETKNPLAKKVSEINRDGLEEIVYHLQLDIGHTLLLRTRRQVEKPKVHLHNVQRVDNQGGLVSGQQLPPSLKVDCAEAQKISENKPTHNKGALLLIHGFAQNYHTWHTPGSRSLSDHLATAGYDVFCIDLRGSVRSQEAGAVSPLGVSCYVEKDIPRALDAIEILSGHKQVTLIGHSMGGAISCAAAGKYPDRVKNVISMSGVYTMMHGTLFLRLVCGIIVLFVRLFRFPRRAFLPTDTVGRLLYHLRHVFDRPIALNYVPIRAWTPRSLKPDVLHDFLYGSFEPMSIGVSLDLMTLMWGADLKDRDGKPYFDLFEQRDDFSLLVMAGTADLLASPEDSINAYHRAITKDKKYIVFSGQKDWRDRLNPLDSVCPDGCEVNKDATFGHVDIILGDRAVDLVWPRIVDWLDERKA